MIGGVLLLIVDEVLGQGTWRSIAQTTRSDSQADSLAAPLGCVLLGALFGGLTRADPAIASFPHIRFPDSVCLLRNLLRER